MTELQLVEGCLYVYEDSVLIMTTRGNPTLYNQPFLTLEEAQAWYLTTVPQEQIQVEEEGVQYESTI